MSPNVQFHDPSVILRGKYTRDNFTNNAKLWDRYVIPHLSSLLKSRKVKEQGRLLRVLLIDTAEEGIVTEYLHSHVGLRGIKVETLALTDHPESALAMNMTRLKYEVEVETGDLEAMMLRLALGCKEKRGDTWDLVYIEGLHSSILLRIAVLAFTCTTPGGLMVFDDYTYSLEHDTSCPRRGVDAFVDSHSQLVRSIGPSSWQAIMTRRKRPLRLKSCSSEFYPN